MSQIRIYRKESAAKPVTKLAKATADEIRHRTSVLARVQRPDLLDHFMPTGNAKSAFHRQPAISPSLAKNRGERILDHADKGWTLPESCLGRAGVADASQAQSVLLWIKKHIVEAGLADEAEICVVVE